MSYHGYASTDTQCLIEELEKQNDKTVEALKDVRTQLVEVTRAIYVLAAVQMELSDSIIGDRGIALGVQKLLSAATLSTRDLSRLKDEPGAGVLNDH